MAVRCVKANLYPMSNTIDGPVSSPLHTVGIFQGDIIIQTALEKAIKELKNYPDLIDDALAGLPKDIITSDKYGNNTITQCKKWFINTEIDILLGLRFKYFEKPAVIAIELGETTEHESILGDKNYATSEPHPRRPGYFRAVESLFADENYTIAIFAHGEPELMLFLYTLVLFQLLRRKQDLLENRGYEISTFMSGSAALTDPGTKEQLYLRTIKLRGKVRHAWPKQEGAEITEVNSLTYPNQLPTPVLSPFPDGWANQDILSNSALPVPAQITAISITPTAGNVGYNLPIGTSQQFVATATFSDGSTKNVSPNVVWSSSLPILQISPYGNVKALASGLVALTVTSGGLTDSVIIKVQ